MEPKKPSSDSPEERVDALVRRRDRGKGQRAEKQQSSPGTSPEGGSGKREHRPQLTEKQRIEARRRRAEQRRRGRRSSASSDVPAGGNALSRGVRATGTELRRTAVFLGGAVAAGLDRLGPVGRVFRSGLAELVRTLGRGLAVGWRVAGTGLARLGKTVLAANRVVTPRSATIVAAAAGVIALVVSQFLDFRATEIGQPGYLAVQEIARAPRRDLMTPMAAHSVLLLAVGLLALAGLVGAAQTGRRRFGLLIALCGLATIAAGVAIDLPTGLDVTEAEISYTGVAAVLLTGFWLQLAAGAVLAGTGLGLAATGSRPASSPARSRRSDRNRSRSRQPAAGSPA